VDINLVAILALFSLCGNILTLNILSLKLQLDIKIKFLFRVDMFLNVLK